MKTQKDILKAIEIAMYKIKEDENLRKAALIRFGLQMIAAKDTMLHGSFCSWVENNIGELIQIRMVQYYMRAARRFLRSDHGAVYFTMTAEELQDALCVLSTKELLNAMESGDELSSAILAYVHANPDIRIK